MKYATYDAQGNVTGHYSDDIHAKIPDGAAPMTDEEWALSCQGQLTRDTAKGKWATKSDPTATELLEAARESKKTEINQARSTAINGGLSHAGYQWDSGTDSRENITGTVAAITAGIPLPSGFEWRTSDNQDVPMTAEQMVALGAAMMEHINTQYRKSWAKKKEIAEATSIEEIQGVSW